MNTPICDFVKEYNEKNTLRFHMPGHKGRAVLGPESFDITEIVGADVLYHEDGIIGESEANAAALFGTAKTVYSTEGSSLCIRAMLFLLKKYAKSLGSCRAGKKPLIAAGRNAHKTFVTAAALLDIDVEWMYSEGSGLVSCELSAKQVESVVLEKRPDAVYITSPDYLGNIADISAIAAVCHAHGCLLIVDNAHGAYLKFMPGQNGEVSRHPIDLGADACCDSAHKTLPALTGGAYLHFSKDAPAFLKNNAEQAMTMFATTSPSYVIMQSLDMCNRLIAEGLGAHYREKAAEVLQLKKALLEYGYTLLGQEALKLTIDAKAFGYTGGELEALLEKDNIFLEFFDPDYIVMMISSGTTGEELQRLQKSLMSICRKAAMTKEPMKPGSGKRRLGLSEAMLCESEEIEVKLAKGRILAETEVACPPAIPIAISGEEIDENAIQCFVYYGIDRIRVVKEMK